jgi:hypothetical protein
MPAGERGHGEQARVDEEAHVYINAASPRRERLPLATPGGTMDPWRQNLTSDPLRGCPGGDLSPKGPLASDVLGVEPSPATQEAGQSPSQSRVPAESGEPTAGSQRTASRPGSASPAKEVIGGVQMSYMAAMGWPHADSQSRLDLAGGAVCLTQRYDRT